MTTIPDSALDLLNGKTVTLSTINDDGTIQSTAIWVHYADGVLATSLAKNRKKFDNLIARPDQATLHAISTENPFHTLEVRATVSIEPDDDKTFFTELLGPYGQTLESMGPMAAEDRVKMVFHPTRVRAS